MSRVSEARNKIENVQPTAELANRPIDCNSIDHYPGRRALWLWSRWGTHFVTLAACLRPFIHLGSLRSAIVSIVVGCSFVVVKFSVCGLERSTATNRGEGGRREGKWNLRVSFWMWRVRWWCDEINEPTLSLTRKPESYSSGKSFSSLSVVRSPTHHPSEWEKTSENVEIKPFSS